MRYNYERRRPRFTESPLFTLDLGRRTLTIHATDVNISAYPSGRPRRTRRGNTVWSTLEPPTTRKSKYWKEKIGDELCRQFLLLRDVNAHFGADSPKYRLTEFPSGYNLCTRKEGTRQFHDDVRKDTYLFGQTSGRKFQSPQEAALHFAWLMRGKPNGRCKCIYCAPGRRQRQKPINKEMKEMWIAYLDEECKRRYEEFKKREACRKSGETYDAPSTPVDRYNEDMYLLPAPIERGQI
ncbi:hypothetical protein M408DRAFT_186878 [Serendipita vermifera MAFF 305830]|uniref:Cryptic loci regulator 2 N-terminal domain-containing protein n=1 Tax=Serendipita vermifera MAFF 305830 TaxID=933852 RepID=A0A0C2XV94_SERVB|nr:hypothetical protein M408DRAFT_186878 [Serendipita vermifera MAFF 305830]